MDIREKQYERLEITNEIPSIASFDNRIYTYIGRKEYEFNNNENVGIMDQYIKLLNQIEVSWGKEVYTQFINSIELQSFNIIKGKYKFLDRLQNSFTGR